MGKSVGLFLIIKSFIQYLGYFLMGNTATFFKNLIKENQELFHNLNLESNNQDNDSAILKYITNRYIHFCIEEVRENGLALTNIEYQTNAICLEAVKQNGCALKYVKNQTIEICLEAVKKNGLALEDVKNQTPEICLEAVKQKGKALQYVKNQTPELCLEAVKNDPNCIDLVNIISKDIIENIKQNKNHIAYFEEMIEAKKRQKIILDSL